MSSRRPVLLMVCIGLRRLDGRKTNTLVGMDVACAGLVDPGRGRHSRYWRTHRLGCGSHPNRHGFASVYHAEVIAHRTGEPFGTLVLALAVTVIETALIISIMSSC